MNLKSLFCLSSNRNKRSKLITRKIKITATPEVMRRFDRFLGFMHYNCGHSNLFAMYFDGDGSDILKVSPAPKMEGDMYMVNTGQSVEVAGRDGFSSYPINHDKHHYTVRGGVLYRVSPDDEATQIKIRDRNYTCLGPKALHESQMEPCLKCDSQP